MRFEIYLDGNALKPFASRERFAEYIRACKARGDDIHLNIVNGLPDHYTYQAMIMMKDPYRMTTCAEILWEDIKGRTYNVWEGRTYIEDRLERSPMLTKEEIAREIVDALCETRGWTPIKRIIEVRMRSSGPQTLSLYYNKNKKPYKRFAPIIIRK